MAQRPSVGSAQTESPEKMLLLMADDYRAQARQVSGRLAREALLLIVEELERKAAGRADGEGDSPTCGTLE